MAAELVQSNVKLSIGILVSNRIETIRRCMDSLVPVLKAVPSELIALDTVGEATDGSAEIVKEYTDKIYRYHWCQDFADARNTCLSYSSGEWFLFLDDDEWFDHADDLISFFQNGESEQYQFGMFLIRNYGASGSYSTTITSRMIRRREDTHFVGKIHEVFHEVFPPGKQFESFLHHSGYAFADEAAKKKHQERNLSILQKEIEEEGISARNCAQLVQELLFRKETAAEGFRYCMECIPALKEQESQQDSCFQWLLVASVRYFHTLHNYEEIKRQTKYVKENYVLTEMAELALFGISVHAAVEAYDIAVLPELAEQYLQKWDFLKTHSEIMLAQSQLDFPKYLEEKYLIQVLQAGATAANGLGQYEKAYDLWTRIPWKSRESDYSVYQQELLKTLRNLPNPQPLLAYYYHFYKDECFLPENRACLPEECRKALEEMNM